MLRRGGVGGWVSTNLKKYDRQIGNLAQVGVNIKNIWNHHLDVSENSGTPKSSHFNRVFHYKPSILRYPYFWNHHLVFQPPQQLKGPPWVRSSHLIQHVLGQFLPRWKLRSWNSSHRLNDGNPYTKKPSIFEQPYHFSWWVYKKTNGKFFSTQSHHTYTHTHHRSRGSFTPWR